MKLRQHRGSFAESMETLVHIEPTAQALQEYISQQWPPGMTLLSMKYHGHDARRSQTQKAWGDTWLVGVQMPDGTTGVFGMTDQIVEGLSVTEELGFGQRDEWLRKKLSTSVDGSEVSDRDFFNMWTSNG